MKLFTAIPIVLAVCVPIGAAAIERPTDFSSARSAYAAKKAECKERAKSRHFGIHWIKRNRWIKNCIASAHSPAPRYAP